MTTPAETTPDPGAATTGNNATATTTGQQAAIDWESADNPYKKRFVGQQGAYQKLFGEHETLKGKNFDLDQQVKAVLGEKDSFAAQMATIKEQHDTASGELEVLKASRARLDLIVKEFPDLLEFEAQGILPDGNEEEIKPKLTAFRDALARRGSAEAQKVLGGGTPPPPPPAKDKTAKEHLADAIAAQRKGDMAVYEAEYAKYIDELTKEQSK
jgi:hypothetical protein